MSLAIEIELVIRLGRDIDANRLSDEQLIACINALSAGIELHHFKFWFGKPTAQERIISNGLFAGLLMDREKTSPGLVDFQTEMFRVLRDGVEIAQGTAKEIMGGPLASLRWLATKLAQRGEFSKPASSCFPVLRSP